jgi:hypothetical protein
LDLSLPGANFINFLGKKANGKKCKFQKKIELCEQKIFEAFLAYSNQRKAAYFSFAQKAACKYVDEMDARMEGALCGTP